MKIALVTPVFLPYLAGIGNVARQEAAELSRRGHQVSVFTPLYNAGWKTNEKIDGVQILRVKSWLKFGKAAWVPDLIQQLYGFDVVHLHYPFIGAVGAVQRAVLHHHIPLVVTYHMDLLAEGWKGLFFKLYELRTLSKLIRIASRVVVSTWDYALESSLAKYIKKESSKFVEAPFGVDTDLFQPAESGEIKVGELRKKLSLAHGDKVVLFVGGLDQAHAFKGLNALLRAFNHLREGKLIIVGEGGGRRFFELQAKKLGWPDRVIFAGRLADEDLVHYYQMADMLVLPSQSRSEAYGMVLLEAMSCGKPVIATNLPGVRIQVGAERGLLVPLGQSQPLKEAIEKMLSDDFSRVRAGALARQWVLAERTVKGEIDKLEAVYQSIAHSK